MLRYKNNLNYIFDFKLTTADHNLIFVDARSQNLERNPLNVQDQVTML
jgi:hypothetical protein